jgi:AcrR family transcriptional regulator
MGIKERHEREREAVTRAILDAARELFVAEGYRNVSMRKIAERIEYSAASIYSYFPAKDDIFFALAEEGFRLLGQPPDDLARASADPIERIRGGFWHYYEFSRAYPQYFELIFVDRSVPRISQDWDRFGFVRDMMRHFVEGIRESVEAGVFPAGTDPAVAFHVIWAAVHGAAVIALSGRMAPGEDPDALARDTLEAAIAGLRAGIRTTFVADACHLTRAEAPEPSIPHAAVRPSSEPAGR